MNGAAVIATSHDGVTQIQVFGLVDPYFCRARVFFRRINHPGANNCRCPKMDEGRSCVPFHMWGAWFAYTGLDKMYPAKGDA